MEGLGVVVFVGWEVFFSLASVVWYVVFCVMFGVGCGLGVFCGVLCVWCGLGY